jgi:hypothetical protein
MNYHYTIASDNPNDYSYIRTSLHPPPTVMSEMVVSNITTQHSFRTLSREDYIAIELNRKVRRHHFTQRYSNLTQAKFIKILSQMLGSGFIVEFDEEKRFIICTKPMVPFKIIDMSYNVKILTGLYNTTFPIISTAAHSYICPNKRYQNLNHKAFLWPHSNNVYIIVNGKKYFYEGEPIQFGEIDDYVLWSILNDMLKPEGLIIRYTNRYNLDPKNNYESLTFVRDHKEIRILCSLDFQNLTGSGPTSPEKYQSGVHYHRAESVGYFNLTPVLYLLSNLGSTCYCNDNQDDNPNRTLLNSQQIVMRINNYFIDGLPIIANNIEFTSIIPSSSLTNCWFKLVDANFQPLKLLSPMYLSIVVIGMVEKPIERPIYITSEDK